MIFKIDSVKAYDRLERSFIQSTLEDVGLPKEMVGTIMEYISSGSFHLLWNGEETEAVRPTREIRQADSISS